MKYFDRYKTLRLNEKFLHISVANEAEDRAMDKEHIQLETRLELENTQGPKGSMKGLSFYDIRKINEANLKEMKGRMQDHIKKKIQEHRMLKDQDRVEHKRRELEALEDKQADVLKQHKIDQLIKSEQKAELERNVAVFRHLNKEEKGLRRELCDKQVEL